MLCVRYPVRVDDLDLPLDQWTDETPRLLIGRMESDELDAKGYRDLGAGDSRKGIRRAIAGFASEAGGILVIGATTRRPEGGDVEVLDQLLGLEVSDEDWWRVCQGVYDAVRPRPVFESRRFDCGDGKSIVIVRVRANPSGLPSSADGQFYQRVGAATLPMDWDSVRRRFESIADRERRAEDRASEVRSKAFHLEPVACPDPNDEHLYHGADRALGGSASVPTAGPHDLGTTARSLRTVVADVFGEEAAVWLRHGVPVNKKFAESWDLTGWRQTAFGDGLMAHGYGGRLVLFHDGSVTFLSNLIANGEIHPLGRDFEAWSGVALLTTARLIAVAFAIQRRLGLGGSARVAFSSGLELVQPTEVGAALMGMPREPVEGWATLPLVRNADPTYEFIRTMVQRMRDTVGEPSLDVVEPDFRAYLRDLDTL